MEVQIFLLNFPAIFASTGVMGEIAAAPGETGEQVAGTIMK